MSKTVRISPLLVLLAVLIGASLGDLVGGLFGGFVAALLAIPSAGAFQVIAREAWRLTAPPSEAAAEQAAMESAAGEPAQEAGDLGQQGMDDDNDGRANDARPGSADPAARGLHLHLFRRQP